MLIYCRMSYIDIAWALALVWRTGWMTWWLNPIENQSIVLLQTTEKALEVYRIYTKWRGCSNKHEINEKEDMQTHGGALPVTSWNRPVLHDLLASYTCGGKLILRACSDECVNGGPAWLIRCTHVPTPPLQTLWSHGLLITPNLHFRVRG